MYIRPDETHLGIREARAHLSKVCYSDKATVIMDRNQPTAILIPIHVANWYRPIEARHGIAQARLAFDDAIRDTIRRMR